MEKRTCTQALSHILTITSFHAQHFIHINDTERADKGSHWFSHWERVLQHSTVNHSTCRWLSFAPDLSRCAHGCVQMCSWNAYLPTSFEATDRFGVETFCNTLQSGYCSKVYQLCVKHCGFVQVLHKNDVLKWPIKLAVKAKVRAIQMCQTFIFSWCYERKLRSKVLAKWHVITAEA